MTCGKCGKNVLFKHRQVHCKKKHILPPQAATSQVERKRNVFTSAPRERLHKQGVTVIQWRAACAAWRCEVEPDGSVKWSLASSFAIFLLFKNALMGLPSFHSGYPAFLQKKMAEREGFEPSVPVRIQRFSRPSPSTTQPSLRCFCL